MTTEKYLKLPQATKDRMKWNKGISKYTDDDYFKENSPWTNETIKIRILEKGLIPYKCISCGILDTWNNLPIKLDMDHINGVSNDHRLENLRFLCPNCHSQTHSYKGRNINSGKIKVSDEDLWNAYLKEGNIRKALLFVGLAAKGGNYTRLNKLIEKSMLL